MGHNPIGIILYYDKGEVDMANIIHQQKRYRLD